MIAMISKIWMMSLQAGVLILIVMAARLFLKKYPRVYSYVLWAVVGLRLLCPIWVEIPVENAPVGGFVMEEQTELPQMQQVTQNTEVVQPEVPVQNVTNIHSDTTKQEMKPEQVSVSSTPEKSNAWKALLPKVLISLYLAGVFTLGTIYLVQYIVLKRRLATAVHGKENVWFSENINTPFVMGVVHPRIYLPYGLDKVSGRYILKHERTHIEHHDPIIRLLGVLCLCLHWWNPLVWLAVYLMNQDMEMCCDEGFLLRAPLAERKAYADVLLSFAQKRSGLWVELAFGESHTEKRIKNVLYPKKKGTVSLVIVALVMLLCGCSFLTESTDTDNAEKPSNLLGNAASEEKQESDDGQEGDARPEDNGGQGSDVRPESNGGQDSVDGQGKHNEQNNVENEEESENSLAVQESTVPESGVKYNILAELRQTETLAAQLQNQMQKDSSLTQSDLNSMAQEHYLLWDDQLNVLWNLLKQVLEEEEMSALTIEEREWIAYKESEVEVAGAPYEGGSIQPLIVNQKQAELTRERVYELAVYLGEKTGQTIPVQGGDEYSGLYVDTQGTYDIFSELDLVYLGDGLYKVTMGLYRLTTLEGYARLDGESLLFEDEDMLIKGEIFLQDAGAVFRATESAFAYIEPEEEFVFPEKW